MVVNHSRALVAEYAYLRADICAAAAGAPLARRGVTRATAGPCSSANGTHSSTPSTTCRGRTAVGSGELDPNTPPMAGYAGDGGRDHRRRFRRQRAIAPLPVQWRNRPSWTSQNHVFRCNLEWEIHLIASAAPLHVAPAHITMDKSVASQR